MRLFEAILEANHQAVAGDASAGLHPSEFRDSLPVVALTCIDPRLNRLLPQVMGVRDEDFIWLRNAGNIVTGPLSSTMRSLALACAVKEGKEIAVIGHTDCQVRKTTAMQLLEQLRKLGIERHSLPENIAEFFGMFASEQQNVLKAVEYIRHSPIISSKVPVHGLILDTETGKLDWVSNGYQSVGTMSDRWQNVIHSGEQTLDALKKLNEFPIGEIKFPETRIGESVVKAEDWLSAKLHEIGSKSTSGPKPSPAPSAPITPQVSHPMPVPPTIASVQQGSTLPIRVFPRNRRR